MKDGKMTITSELNFGRTTQFQEKTRLQVAFGEHDTEHVNVTQYDTAW